MRNKNHTISLHASNPHLGRNFYQGHRSRPFDILKLIQVHLEQIFLGPYNLNIIFMLMFCLQFKACRHIFELLETLETLWKHCFAFCG